MIEEQQIPSAEMNGGIKAVHTWIGNLLRRRPCPSAVPACNKKYVSLQCIPDQVQVSVPASHIEMGVKTIFDLYSLHNCMGSIINLEISRPVAEYVSTVLHSLEKKQEMRTTRIDYSYIGICV